MAREGELLSEDFWVAGPVFTRRRSFCGHVLRLSRDWSVSGRSLAVGVAGVIKDLEYNEVVRSWLLII